MTEYLDADRRWGLEVVYLGGQIERHVVPVADLIGHAPFDCVCGPNSELIESDELGPDVWLVSHHALDGRK